MVMQDHIVVDKEGGNMKKLSKNEMLNIAAGGSISGTLVNSIWNGVKAFVDVGRNVGSALRRIIDKNLCRY